MGKTKTKYKVNDIIDNRFKVLNILKGGMGVVYVCEDQKENEIIALKTIHEKLLIKENIVNNFKREALAWVHLENHPNIVNAKMVLKIDNQPYILMEYIAPDKLNRNTLSSYMKDEISLKEALNWGIQVCHALEYSAERGVTPHRDIKPDNIMITVDRNLKVTDFGIAKLWDDDEITPDWDELKDLDEPGLTFIRVTKKGEKVEGTVVYMSPEQFKGKTDMRSDIYSVGIVLYQTINKGKKPFDYYTIRDYYYAHTQEEPPPLDSKLFPIINKCLKKKPKDRYQNFKELRKDLEELYKSEFGKDPLSLPKRNDLEAWEHYNKGVSFQTLGFYKEAINEFNKAIDIKPGYLDPKVSKGIVNITLELYDEGIKVFRDLLKVKPNYLDLYKLLGYAFRKKGDLKESLENYKKILKLSPYEPENHYNLGKAWELSGNIENAILVFENFILNAPPQHSKFKDRLLKAKKRVSKLKKKLK